MTVLDTSAAIDYLIAGEAFAEVDRLLQAERQLAAPDLLVFEVLAVLRRNVQRHLLEERDARSAVDMIADLPLVLFESIRLRRRAWDLRDNFRIADALFVALAEMLDEPLATKDGPLAAAVETHTNVSVILI